jgi:ABC-type amino acid transport substrate-binding protein
MNKNCILTTFSGLIFVIIFSPMTVMAQLAGTTFAEAQASKKANWVFTYADTPGFASKQPNGNIEGLVVDIMTKFAEYVEKEEGIKVKFEFKAKNPDDFKLFLGEVKSSKGGVFGLANVTITETRKKEYNFSPAYIKNISMICTHKDVNTLESMKDISKDFAGMKAVVGTGTTNEQVLKEIKAKHFPSLQIQTYSSIGESVEAVIKDKKSFTSVDFVYYLAAVKQNQPIKRHPAGDQSTEEFGVVMPLSNDWSPLLAKFFNSGFIGGNDYRRIVSTHLGSNAVRLLDSIAAN